MVWKWIRVAVLLFKKQYYVSVRAKGVVNKYVHHSFIFYPKEPINILDYNFQGEAR